MTSYLAAILKFAQAALRFLKTAKELRVAFEYFIVLSVFLPHYYIPFWSFHPVILRIIEVQLFSLLLTFPPPFVFCHSWRHLSSYSLK